MERLKFKDERLWKGLLVLGILLNILVCFTSDLGLDTQVKMAVDDNGALPWGDLRPDTLGESDPEDGRFGSVRQADGVLPALQNPRAAHDAQQLDQPQQADLHE